MKEPDLPCMRPVEPVDRLRGFPLRSLMGQDRKNDIALSTVSQGYNTLLTAHQSLARAVNGRFGSVAPDFQGPNYNLEP